MGPGLVALFLVTAIILAVAPCVLAGFWQDAPRRAYAVPHAVAQPGKPTPYSTDPLRNTRFLESYTTSVGGATTLRQLWDRSVDLYGASRCLGWRLVDEVTTEPFTYGLDDGGRRTRTVEKWVLKNSLEWLSYSASHQAVLQVGGGFVALLEDMGALAPSRDPRAQKPHVGILCSSRPESTLATLACAYHGLTAVLLPWCAPRTLQHCIEATQCSILVCESHQMETVAALLSDTGDSMARRCRSLRMIVPLRDRNDPAWSLASPLAPIMAEQLMAGFTGTQARAVRDVTALGATVLPWRALLALGEQGSPLLRAEAPAALPTSATGKQGTSKSVAPESAVTPSTEPRVTTAALPDALPATLFAAERVQRSSTAVITFSAGGRGQPRPVQLSHGNLLAALASYAVGVPALNHTDTMLSYSSVAAPLELIMQLALLSQGGAVACGYPDSLTAHSKRIPALTPSSEGGVVQGDAAIVRPTIMAVLPTQLDRLMHEVEASVAAAGWAYDCLVWCGRRVKQSATHRGVATPLWNWLVFEPLRRATFGGNLRVVVATGAPVLPPLHQFMSEVMSCPIVQVYGCAESAGMGTMSWPLRRRQDSAGPPVACGRLKLADWPDIGVSVKGKALPIGEICLSGANLGSGYSAHAMPDMSRDGGWLRTGDVGQILGDGTLHVLGRKHEIVRLANGKLVSLARIEAAARLSPYVAAVVAYADASHAVAVVLVVPDVHAMLRTQALRRADKDISLPRSANGDLALSLHVAVHSSVVHTFLLDAIQHQCAQCGMAAWQMPRGIALVSNEWSMEAGTLTHMGTPVRHRVWEAHEAELERAFAKADVAHVPTVPGGSHVDLLDDAPSVLDVSLDADQGGGDTAVQVLHTETDDASLDDLHGLEGSLGQGESKVA